MTHAWLNSCVRCVGAHGVGAHCVGAHCVCAHCVCAHCVGAQGVGAHCVGCVRCSQTSAVTAVIVEKS